MKLRVLLATFASLGLLACSDDAADDNAGDSGIDAADGQADSDIHETSPEPSIPADRVLVKAPENVTDFVATLACDNEIVTVSCPSPAHGGFECTTGGLALLNIPSGKFTVTLKARGYTFPSATFDASTLPNVDGKLIADTQPRKLPAREITDDYATYVNTAEEFQNLGMNVTTELGNTTVVKFYIRDVATDNPTVYFQNTNRHRLHYNFARDVLNVAQTGTEFERQTYSGTDRTAMAGSIVFYGGHQPEGKLSQPYTISFLPFDNLTPDQAALAYRLVEERLHVVNLAGMERRVAYMPAGAVQEQQLASNLRVFDKRDDKTLAMSELYADIREQRLNTGVAFGTLKVMTAEELAKTIVSFRDILVLRQLPNDLPLVGGTITEQLQTPLAHVNVAAHNRGTPNLALLGASTDARVAPLVRKLVRFEVTPSEFSIREATLEEAEAHWAAQQHPEFVPRHDDTEGFIHFKDVQFGDSNTIGVKAQNVAELTRLLPDNTPSGFAVRFGSFDKYMRTNTVKDADCPKVKTNCLNGNRTADVCDAVQEACANAISKNYWELFEILEAMPRFKTDTLFREGTLNMLQFLISNGKLDDAFGAELMQRIVDMFGDSKVRIRSSTNAEDLEEFSGAGLYRSVSAYGTGTKKLATKQILKVWASLFTFRAYEERSFWNVKHRDTRMGCAVETSYPNEQANGVVITRNIANPAVAGMYVNVQKGEEPITNPTTGDLPEVFVMVPSPEGGYQVQRQRFSTLSANTPLLSDAEVQALAQASQKVHQHFARLYKKDENSIAFDLEFKFHGPERQLIIKQVRPYN